MADNNTHGTEKSPCLSCTSVDMPNFCTNVNCARWQKWFIARWDYLAEQLRQKLKEKDEENEQKA